MKSALPGVTVFKMAAVILGWLGATVTTVVLNKHIFQNMNWRFPISLTIVHMVICAAGSYFALRVFKLIPFTVINQSEYRTGVLPLRYVQKLLAHPFTPLFTLRSLIGST